MAPEKRRRRNTPVPESPIGCKLPVDLILEIVARTDTSTLISCAASCKLLRRDILSQSFIRRVTQRDGIVPPHILAYLYTDDDVDAPRPLLLVHPVTPAAISFSDGHLSPFMSCHTADVLGEYEPVTSRGGLILLRRRNIRLLEHRSDYLCVYDSMTGDRTFFSDPPAISKDQDVPTYVLLTATDGIGCSFKLLAVDVDSYKDDIGCNIKVQTATSSNVGDTSWGALICDGDIDLPLGSLQEQRDAIVLHGNVIHWLVWDDEEILTYNIQKQKLGVVKLPPINFQERQRHLGRSPDGRLQLLVTDGFLISVWLQQCGGSWLLEAVMDAEEKLRTLDPCIPLGPVVIEFECSGEMSCVVLLKIWFNELHHGPLIVLDLETKEMRRQAPHPPSLFEVDLSAWLLAMKTFS